MLARAKKIAAVILSETATPAAVMVLSHNLRAALMDLAAELVDLNQRLDLVEQSKGDPDGKI
jgi:hypothetical protein